MATDTVHTNQYEKLLHSIEGYLASYGDRRWATVLAEWRVELDRGLSAHALSAHVRRTIKATGGMESLGDLSISPGNGHHIIDDPAAIARASEKLWRMTAELYREAKNLLDKLGDESSQ